MYTVLSNINHDGTLYKRGDKIELNEDVAEQLINDGVISDEETPVVVEKDWKKGPKPVVHPDDVEVSEDGEVVKTPSEDENDNPDDEDNTYSL